MVDGAANTRTTISLSSHVNRDGSKLFIFISGRRVQVGARLQVLLEKDSALQAMIQRANNGGVNSL